MIARWNPDPQRVTFGIEIEVSVPFAAIDREGFQVGGYHRPRKIEADGPGKGFYAGTDGSIPPRNEHEPVEFVSPVLCGERGLRRAMAFGKWLQSLDAKVAGSGFHVHIGLESLLGEDSNDAAKVADYLRRLINLVGQHEEALFASTGTIQRRNNYYCRSLKRTHQPEKPKPYHRYEPRPACAENRYHVLNVTRVYGEYDERRTLEFRCWASTTNPIKIATYVQMAIALCIKAAKENPRVDWTKPAFSTTRATRTGLEKAPQAWKELRRFIDYVGWQPKMARTGWILPYDEFHQPIHDELKRLAYRYAQEAHVAGMAA